MTLPVRLSSFDILAFSGCTSLEAINVEDGCAAYASVDGMLTDGRDGCKRLFVTLGFFSVIRIERPGQYLINATEYSVPEKECVSGDEEDPCAVFEKMAFPVNEFSPPPYR